MTIIIEITFNNKPLVVEKTPNETYQIRYDGKITHPDLKSEDVIRAMGFYMNNSSTVKAK